VRCGTAFGFLPERGLQSISLFVMDGGVLVPKMGGEARSKRAKGQNPPVAVPSCGICILAGGLSSRMGRPKAGLRLASRTLLAHVRAEAQRLGLPVRIIRRDQVARCGPLGGVYTALKTSRAAAELFLACDMPFVSAGLLRQLLDVWARDQEPIFVTAGVSAGFPFLIPVKALRVVEAQISKKEFSLQKLAQALKSRLHPAGEAEGELFNVNTPADWRLARQRFRKRTCKSGL
jgi:molybdopterin-guanine dinucleotide biosynthesis protein A